jgi:hypothetical protein
MSRERLADAERHEALAKQILTSRGAPSVDEFAAATALVEDKIPQVKPPAAVGLHSADRETRWVWIIGLGTLYGLCTVILPGWLAAGIFRGGVLLRAFGLAVVKRNGEPASRGRMVWRNFVAAAPFVVAAYALHGQSRWLAALPLCLAIALAVCSALMLGRTLQDRLAGTDLVPR